MILLHYAEWFHPKRLGDRRSQKPIAGHSSALGADDDAVVVGKHLRRDSREARFFHPRLVQM